MKKLQAFHLFNDFSGSCRVFEQFCADLIDQGYPVIVNTSKTDGLINTDSAHFREVCYERGNSKLKTLWNLIKSQIASFKKVWSDDDSDTILINTVLPFGAAIAGKLRRKKVVYHIHETSISPALLKRFLFSVANLTASDVIYVSDFLRSEEPLNKPRLHVIHNGLSRRFQQTADKNFNSAAERFNQRSVLMLASLKTYKGILELNNLALRCPGLDFDLLVNASQGAIDEFYANQVIPTNVSIHPATKNVHQYYQKASLILNLSRPDQWVETFGMTVAEGMMYGLPAIVPTVGGITELVDNHVNGYKVSCYELERIAALLQKITQDKDLYTMLSDNARARSKSYNAEVTHQRILKVLQAVSN